MDVSVFQHCLYGIIIRKIIRYENYHHSYMFFEVVKLHEVVTAAQSPLIRVRYEKF